MTALKQHFNDFVSLFYPKLCLACQEKAPPKEELICIHCHYNMSKTNFHLDKENAFAKQFWGRMPIATATAMYFFVHGGRVQQLIHNLKYEGKKEVGSEIGKAYGKILKEQTLFQDVDLILPVPLHPRKKRLRGYNQSAMFAMGLAESMEVGWKDGILARTAFTETQTKKSRLNRFENVDHAFFIAKPDLIENKHILLVDDVMTTGATLEACGQRIIEIPGTRLSLATIAIGSPV